MIVVHTEELWSVWDVFDSDMQMLLRNDLNEECEESSWKGEVLESDPSPYRVASQFLSASLGRLSD